MAQDENRDKIRPKLRGKRFFVTASSRTAGTDTMETKDYTIISNSFSFSTQNRAKDGGKTRAYHPRYHIICSLLQSRNTEDLNKRSNHVFLLSL